MQNVSDVYFNKPILQQNMDSFLSPVFIPVSKLDADQYVAEDLDGVTESLFGSGNLNFLMMQAGQSNAQMITVDPFTIAQENYAFDTNFSALTGFGGVSSAGGHDFSYQAGSEAGEAGGNFVIGGAGILSSVTGGIPGFTSSFHTGADIASNDGRGVSGVNGLSGTDGQGALPGVDGANGTSGTNGLNGQDGTGGGDTIIHNELIEVTEVLNLGDVILNFGDINLGDVNINLGDLTIIDLGDVTNLITVTITDITNIITNIMDGGLTLQLDAILSNITDLDLTLISGDTVFNLINQVIDLSPVTDLLEPIIDLDGLILGEVHSIFSLLQDGQHEHQPGDMDIGLGVNNILGDLPLINGVTDIILNPVEDLIGDIDVLADLGLDLFNNQDVDNANGDTDVTLDLGLGLLDGTLVGGALHIPLDPVEAIIGDVDLDLGAATNLLGDMAQGIVDQFSGGSGSNNLLSGIGDQLTGLVGGVLPNLGQSSPLVSLNGDLFGQTQTDNGAGDSDLALNLSGGHVMDLPLDPIEAITGDIDLSVSDVVEDVLSGIGGDTAYPDLALGAEIGVMDHALPDLDIAQSLDFLEPLTGDIDLASDIGADLLGQSETDNTAGDTDIDLDLDLDVLGMDIVEIDFIDVPLDPLEAITGDLDLNLNAALDLLNPQAQDGGIHDLLQNNTGGDGLLAWTENTLPDLGNLFGDHANHGVGSILPAPIGDIAEGLGGLLGGGDSSGGLFGGNLGGGIFG